MGLMSAEAYIVDLVVCLLIWEPKKWWMDQL
jgi:hypothetical protein